MYERTSRAGYARRIDVSLRARFPHLRTRLFELQKDKFQIVFDSRQQDAQSISEEFNHSIRFMTVHVTLANTLPESYVRELPVLSDEDALAEMCGLPLRKLDLVNILTARFPNAGIEDVKETPDNYSATIFVKHPLPEAEETRILDFVEALSLPIVFSLVVSSDQHENVTSALDDPMFIWASALRPQAPTYTRDDEEFWFNNIQDIAANKLPIDSFPGMQPDTFRCYLDLSLGERHVNLRQALLLYDEVWCSLPLRERHQQFLEQQSLTEEDLLIAVELGRLRFVSTQPEERLQLPFLDRICERKSTAIFGRRTTAGLLVADVVGTADTSFLRDNTVASALVELAHMVSDVEGVPLRKVIGGFLWPLASRRGALQGLLARGSKAGPIIELSGLLSARLQARTGLDIELETLIFGESVHIAHALNATLLGPLTEPPGFRQLKYWIGRHLNFHRSFNQQRCASWQANERSIAAEEKEIPTVPLFEFDKTVPMREILEDSAPSSVRSRGRGLYTRLAKMSVSERRAEIERLSTVLREMARRSSNQGIALDAVDVGVSAMDLIIGLFVPPLSAIGRFSKPMLERARRNKNIDSMVMQVENRMSNSKARGELEFLSRVSRVATFKVDRV